MSESIYIIYKYTSPSGKSYIGQTKNPIQRKRSLKTGSDVFLFFSMNGSGRFCGVARMKGKVDENKAFEYWAMDEVWRGLMEVEWMFIKDVPNRFLKHIKLSNNAFKPVTNSRDTQEVPLNEGIMMMKLFEEFPYQTSILQHFQYYDDRQDLFEKARNTPQFSSNSNSQQFKKGGR